MEHRQTKGERRESKRRRRSKMGVSGASVRRLQEIILKKREDAERRSQRSDLSRKDPT